jgi:3-hydroxyacyl-[acyl-carrier-protein] dehydratase
MPHKADSHLGEVALGRREIEDLLPHREPFLFLDCAVLGKDEATGWYAWLPGHPIFAGHFPAAPVVPGGCQVEAIAQLAGTLLAWHCGQVRAGMLGWLASIRSASFRKRVGASDRLDLYAKVRRVSSSAFLVVGGGMLAGQPTCEAELLLVLG